MSSIVPAIGAGELNAAESISRRSAEEELLMTSPTVLREDFTKDRERDLLFVAIMLPSSALLLKWPGNELLCSYPN